MSIGGAKLPYPPLAPALGGPEPPLKIPEQKHYANVVAAKVTAPPLFEYLSDDCKPIATRSRQQCNRDDQSFISSEIKRMLEADIIERSRSLWRAQILVVKQGDKKRLVIDYSATINRLTRLDVYPFPRMELL